MNSTLKSALFWLSQGVGVLPCLPGSKVAAVRWTPYKDRLASVPEVVSWFSKPRNLAVVCGPVSRNLVVLDFDSETLAEEWRRENLADTLTVKTARGMHFCYFVSGLPRLASPQGVDVKASGYCLTAPSTHPSGIQYTVIHPGPVLEIEASDLLHHFPASSETPPSDASNAPSSPPHTEHLPWSSLIGEIRRTLPVVSLLARYTQPIPTSPDGRWWIMRCPMPDHEDHHPSFWADNRRGICSCFHPACKSKQPGGKPMDVINLYARLHGCSNREAIFALAEEIGL